MNRKKKNKDVMNMVENFLRRVFPKLFTETKQVKYLSGKNSYK